MSVRVSGHCDPWTVRARFSRAASTYDHAAQHQSRTARMVCRLLPPVFQPKSIVEWGCGTGLLTERLAHRLPAASILALDHAPGMVAAARRRFASHAGIHVVEADVESFVPSAPVDLVISNCVVQWLRDWPAMVERCREWVSPGGMLLFSAPVTGTLFELWESLRRAGADLSVALPMRSPEDYRTPFLEDEWTDVGLWVRSVVARYPGGCEVVRALGHLGATAGAASAGDRSNRIEPGRLRRALSLYTRHFGDERGCVPCTYRVLFLRARRGGVLPAEKDRCQEFS